MEKGGPCSTTSNENTCENNALHKIKISKRSAVANDFVSLDENRSRVFGRFTKTDIQLTSHNLTAL